MLDWRQLCRVRCRSTHASPAALYGPEDGACFSVLKKPALTTKVDGVDQSPGVGQGGPEGRAEVRLCTLGAQGQFDAQGGIQARGRAAPDRARDRATRDPYFKVYKSQLPVIEEALETVGLMLGSNKSRGYCLEMICADFLAGANLAETQQ